MDVWEIYCDKEYFDFLIMLTNAIHPISITSQTFLKLGISTFNDACLYIQNLPYRRNTNKADVFCVLNDKCGTCSTKHALLKQLADEMGLTEVKLMCGIFKMNAVNTPEVATTLKHYHLAYIPEAHNYLRFRNQVYDFTKSTAINFQGDLLEEIEMQTGQINGFKVLYHQQFLQRWLNHHPEIRYTTSELWSIREQCINDIASV